MRCKVSLSITCPNGESTTGGLTWQSVAITVQQLQIAQLDQQGQAASAATNLKQGQDVVFNSLQQRFNDSAGVNIDQEMANLLTLQNSYAANARVLTAVKDMLDTLLKMGA